MYTIEPEPRFVLGPYTRNMFGKSGTDSPRNAPVRSAHLSASDTPLRPTIDILHPKGVVRNPVPNTMTSRSWEPDSVMIPLAVTVTMRPVSNVTFGRLS